MIGIMSFVGLVTIIFTIPGIIVSAGLFLVKYIVIDNPEMGTIEIIKTSWKLMKGHKREYILLWVSFFGWILLCFFIIPIIYVIPYMYTTAAMYYERIKEKEIEIEVQ